MLQAAVHRRGHLVGLLFPHEAHLLIFEFFEVGLELGDGRADVDFVQPGLELDQFLFDDALGVRYLAGSGGEAIVKLRIAEALQGKRIMLLPVSEGGMNLKTTDINRLIETLGIKALSGGK